MRQSSLFNQESSRAARQPKTDRLILARLLKNAADSFHLTLEKIAPAHAILVKWADMEKSGRLQRFSETQMQGDFLSQVFGQALGYVQFTENAATWQQIQHVSDTKHQAVAHLENIRSELETNRHLTKHFARARSAHPTRHRIRLGDVTIEAFGAGQRIRGRRWREHRPTLIICDDLQNDSHIYSQRQRDNSRTWFHGMLLKAGTQKTQIINLATALHREALACELQSTPGWQSRRYQAIQTWPEDMSLWAEWEELYRNGAREGEPVPEGEKGSRGAGENQQSPSQTIRVAPVASTGAQQEASRSDGAPLDSNFGLELPASPRLSQPGAPTDPSGVAAISRGLRSAATTPPDTDPTSPIDPGGVAASDDQQTRWHPSRMQNNSDDEPNRGCRFAQPPANSCDPSGIQNHDPSGIRDRSPSGINVTPDSHSSFIIPNSSFASPPSPFPPFSPSSPHQHALNFYNAHEHQLTAGTKLLWPEVEPLYALMAMRAESGSAIFEREKQCVPMNPEQCEWPESYFAGNIWFDHWPSDLRVRVIALDPSKGTDARHGDYSAFVMLAITNDNLLYVDANLARRPTPQIVTDGVELIKNFRPQLFGIEANQFQSLLGPNFAAELHRQGLIGISPCSLENRLAKQVRIRTLGPLLANNKFRFKSNSAGARMLVQQLQEFPLAKHDDAPDALEMSLRLAESLLQPQLTDPLGHNLFATPNHHPP